MKPIVVDLETSGLDKVHCGIWQIGAVDLNDGGEFLEEGRIDEEDSVEEGALKVIGKSEEELRDENKQSQKELVNKFFKWVGTRNVRNLLCQNPQFDITFLELKAIKYDLKKTFQHRAFDLHSIAQVIHFNINNTFLVKSNEKNSKTESDMNLTNVLKFCGIKDERLQMGNERIVKEGNPHNALEDSKLTAECFSRLLYGKNVFPEYSKFEIPNYLEVKEK